ncbi:DUF4180 domain-containing protein [Pedobacter frigidisoli]|uniref:DUF4180 domain-containing protein n=1 Tax=Pedobacter frigidisoli TaxID=2530455 RepID=A0A4R0P7S0_9SPHI|nr:DUF4180 domain-containing protein [Pedobacter frigidisoli]TCD11528.1 DUF4180 domain-containing protein [Pedobacter frigidisoli]
MEIKEHIVTNIKIAEIISNEIVINSVEDGLDLLGNLYYQDYDKIIIYEKGISPVFFHLKSGLAGEILQKFSNFRVQLAIVGDFKSHTSQSIKDFIYESNKGKQVNFLPTIADALIRLSTL